MKSSLTNCVLFFNFIRGCALKRALTITKTENVFIKNKENGIVKKRLNSFKIKNYFLCDCFCGPLSCPCPQEISAECEAGTEAGEGQFMLASRITQCCTYWKSCVSEAGQVDQKRKVPHG